MSEPSYDLVVIGGGPGGYVAAIRAAQLGLQVACVESESLLGGTCLRIGCIPSKALLESTELAHEARHGFAAHGLKVGELSVDLGAMMKRKDAIVSQLGRGIDGLFKKHGITRWRGHGSLAAPGRVRIKAESTTEVVARSILIATGSTPATLPGVTLDGERIVTSTEALAFSSVPRRLIVIGAGAIGLELGSVWRRLGSEVTVLEYLERILPGMDLEIARDAQRILTKQGLEMVLGARVTGAVREGEGVAVSVEGQAPRQADKVLVAVGRRPFTSGLGLEAAGVACDRRGYVIVDGRFATNVRGVYAIGDVIGGAMLAHKAEEEGVAFVESLVTGYGHVDHGVIPAVVYTHPEVAGVGKTEEELTAEQVPFRKGTFPYAANGRARALGFTEGKVKILAHAQTDRILGVHIVGARAGDLIAEAVAAMAFGASAEDLARTSHAHPSLAEIVKEAALGALGRPLHL